jgi:hypothetical protein
MYKIEPLCQLPESCFVRKIPLYCGVELTEAGKIRVREMITHRLVLAETGHFCLSLRVPTCRGVAISPGRKTIQK